jgi:hypothetical protein
MGNTTITTANVTTDNLYTTGNIGIGVTAPSYRIHARANNTTVTNWITSDNQTATGAYGAGFLAIAANGTNYSYMSQGADGNQYIINALSTGSIIMQTGGAERMRIDSSGNMGIGTSTFNGVKTVVQGAQTGGAPQTSGTTQTYGLLRLKGTTFTSVLDFGTNGGNYNWIQATDSANLATNYDLAIQPNGGNVGIGTSAPSTKFTVSGTQTIRGVGTDNGIYTCLYMDENTAPYTSTFAGYTLSLNTGGNNARTSRLYIDQNGNVMVGVTTASGKFTVIQNAAAIGGYFQSTTATAGYHGVYAEANNSYGVYGKTYNASYGGVLGYNSNNTAFGILGYSTYGFYSASSINVAGTIYTSDARLKENVKPILNSLDILSALNPVSFDWKEKSSRGPSSDFGLIAQEVEQVIPECVFETTTPGRTPEMTHEVSLEEELGTYKGVDYSRFIPFLIAAVKELSDKNTALEARLSALENVGQ